MKTTYRSCSDTDAQPPVLDPSLWAEFPFSHTHTHTHTHTAPAHSPGSREHTGWRSACSMWFRHRSLAGPLWQRRGKWNSAEGSCWCGKWSPWGRGPSETLTAGKSGQQVPRQHVSPSENTHLGLKEGVFDCDGSGDNYSAERAASKRSAGPVSEAALRGRK